MLRLQARSLTVEVGIRQTLVDGSFAIYDDAAPAVTFYRVPYDVESAAKKNEAANIHPFLTERLRLGI